MEKTLTISGKSQTTLGLVWDIETDKFFLKKPGQKMEVLKDQGFNKTSGD